MTLFCGLALILVIFSKNPDLKISLKVIAFFPFIFVIYNCLCNDTHFSRSSGMPHILKMHRHAAPEAISHRG